MRTAAIMLLLAVTVPTVLSVRQVRRVEAGKAPRVINAAGPAGGPQEILVDRGEPIRYYLGRR